MRQVCAVAGRLNAEPTIYESDECPGLPIGVWRSNLLQLADPFACRSKYAQSVVFKRGGDAAFPVALEPADVANGSREAVCLCGSFERLVCSAGRAAHLVYCRRTENGTEHTSIGTRRECRPSSTKLMQRNSLHEFKPFGCIAAQNIHTDWTGGLSGDNERSIGPVSHSEQPFELYV